MIEPTIQDKRRYALQQQAAALLNDAERYERFGRLDLTYRAYAKITEIHDEIAKMQNAPKS